MGNFFESMAEGLSQEEQDIIKSTYGIEASSLSYGMESLEPLSEEEQRLFDPKGFISPYLSRQRVYKARGQLSPMRFNGAVFEAFRASKGLRSNYCLLPGRVLKAVFKKRREEPDIIYRNLAQMDAEELESTARKLCEAEMRRSFDLAQGPLVRFLVLKTGTLDFAVVVTGLHLALLHLDMAEVFAKLTELTVLSGAGGDAVAAAPDPAAAAVVRGYWQKVLADLPDRPVLPRFTDSPKAYRQCAYRAVMPQELMASLAEKAGGDIRQQVELLQMAWGLLLQYCNGSSDTYFLLLSDASQGAGGTALNMIPVRLKCPPEEQVESVAARLARQIALSQPFSCYEGQGLEELLGEQHDLFSHFLNFQALGQGALQLSGGASEQPLEQVWDAQGLPLGLYFQPAEGRIAVTILYNQYSLKEAAVAELVERYFLTLKAMLLHMEMPVRAFKAALKKRMEAFLALDKEEATAERLAGFLASLPFFQGLPQEKIQRLAKAAKLRTYFESDQIIMGHEAGHLFFLLEGQVARHMDPGSGWFSLLDAAKGGRLLNETALLPECRSRVMGEVLSEQAKVIVLPLPQTVDLLNTSEEFRGRLFQHILKEMEKYQRRWVSN